MNIKTRCNTSIGRISRNGNSPKIQEIVKIKSRIKTVGKICKSGNWIRSNPKTGGSKINILPINSWNLSKSVNGKLEYKYQSNSGDFESVSISPNFMEWQLITSIDGSQDIVKYSKVRNRLQVKHSSIVNECSGRILRNNKYVEF